MESVKFAAPVDNDEKWKQKKNYGPAALFTVLLLGTAFLAGKSYASYGSNASTPTGSLLATGVSLGRCAHNTETAGAPKECPEGYEFFSVTDITDQQKCLSDDTTVPICGEICVSPFNTALLDLLAPGPGHAPSSHGERYRKGNCASVDYHFDTGKNIVLSIPMLKIEIEAYIYTDE